MGQARQVDRQERPLLRQRALAHSDPAPLRRLQEEWRCSVVRGDCSECVRQLPDFARAGLIFVADIFTPLFEVTQDPSTHPELHIFLQRVVGFDSVDDESKAERRLYRKFPLPKDWTTTQNRSYLSCCCRNGR